MTTLLLKFISLPQKHQKKTAFLLQKNVAVLVPINILWLYFVIWDWLRKHLVKLLVLSLWSWCWLCFVVLPVAPHPDHVVDKRWCLQMFPCIRLSQHSALKFLKEKIPQFQMHRKRFFFLHSSLSLMLSWHCELSWWIWTSVTGQLFFWRVVLIIWKQTVEQHHRTAEEGGYLWGSSGPTPGSKQGQQGLVVQSHFQLCFEYLQGQILHISGQPVQPPLW